MKVRVRQVFHISFVLLFLNCSFLGAEQALEGSFAQRLINSPAVPSPFQVILSESGRVSIEAGTVFTEGEAKGLKLPKLASNPQTIELPNWIRGESWQGTVSIALSIREDGTVDETLVMTSSGNEKLDRLAKEVVHGWRFEPATRNGKPVLECIQIPITFAPKG